MMILMMMYKMSLIWMMMMIYLFIMVHHLLLHLQLVAHLNLVSQHHLLHELQSNHIQPQLLVDLHMHRHPHHPRVDICRDMVGQHSNHVYKRWQMLLVYILKAS